MPRHPESVESAISSYLRKMENKGGYSDFTLTNYRIQMASAFRIVTEIQPGAIPFTVTADTLKETLLWMRKNLATSTQKVYFFYIKELLRDSNNHAYDEIRVIYPTDIRPNVDWLSLQDATALLRADMSPLERIIIHLELCHGLRKTEVRNLSLGDIHAESRYFTVLGKGRGGGKYRSVHFHPIFHTVFQDWMDHRSLLTQKCRVSSDDDDALLVYQAGGKLHRYNTGTIAKIVRGISKRTGIEFSSHTLRRTFGREMFHSGVPLVTIAKIMGHNSTEMTLRYIGIDLDDMASAMSQFIIR